MEFFQVVSYECSVCKKSFSNYLALWNHHRFTHIAYFDGTEEPNDEGLEKFSSFKFIPLKNSGDDMNMDMNFMQEQKNIRNCTIETDKTYILLKVEGDADSLIPSKGSELMNQKKFSSQPPIVNIRGPFTCHMPSMHHPELQCGEMFLDCCQYSLHHREKHTKRRKAALRCQVCEKQLDKENIETEFNIPIVEAFPCRMCGQTFLNKAEMEDHIKIAHAKVKPYKCSICDKRFTQLGGLQQHLRLHTGSRPFKCSFCEKGFTQKAGLDQHLRTHTKVKPFNCIVCNKSFSQSVHVRQHMRTHTNIQPFQCSVCGRRFKQTSHLNIHMRSHNRLRDLTSPQSDSMEIFKVTVMPIQDGETIYYSAELPTSLNGQHSTITPATLFDTETPK